MHEVSRQDTAVAAREGSGDRSPDSKRRRVDDEAAPHAIGEVVPHEEHEEEEAGPGLQLSDIGVKVGHRIEVSASYPAAIPPRTVSMQFCAP